MRESQKRAIAKHQKENTKIIPLRLNFNTDQDILQQLDAVQSKMGYIKQLIRNDIEKRRG